MLFAIRKLFLPKVVQLLHKQYPNQLQPVNIFHTSPCKKSLKQWYQGLWMPRKTQPPYRHIVQIGDPVLRHKADEVPLDGINTKEFNWFIDLLIDVLHRYKCVGISAPQVGISLRIIVMEVTNREKENFSPEVVKTREVETLPLTIFINPKLTITSYNKKTFSEGCESVRGYSADVARYESVTLTGFNRKGEPQELQLKGWNARIAQHEMDHLNGIVYTDIMNNKSFSCSCWHMINVKRGQLNIPFYAR